MCYYVLKKNGEILARSTVRNLLPEEWKDETEKQERKEFDKSIAEIYGDFDESLIHKMQNDEMMEPYYNEPENEELRRYQKLG